MISVSEAEKIISSSLPQYEERTAFLGEAYGSILLEDIKTDRDFPAYNKAIMDGIAIKMHSWENGNRIFPIKGIQSAGREPITVKNENQCVEIMTGAVVPEGFDCVIPYEDIKIHKRKAILNGENTLSHMQFVRKKGSDHKKGVTVLKKGCEILAPQVAVAAAVGKAKIKVSKKLNIAIISTGDELVDITKKVKSYQIRKSNSYALQAAFSRFNLGHSSIYHIRDNKENMSKSIKKILKEHDVLVLTGGVSMGKFDYVPDVLQELGVKVLFHKVQQKPGKPFWFGKSNKGVPVFALPGNPVSTQVCAYRYVIPQLRKALGFSYDRQDFVVLSEDYTSDTSFTYFLPVNVLSDNRGFIKAYPVKITGSGDMVALANADGFVELPGGSNHYKAGTSVKLFHWN